MIDAKSQEQKTNDIDEMHMDIVTVGCENFVLGFKISGIKDSFAVNKDNVADTFENLMNNPAVGIIVTEKKTFDMLNERMKEKLMTTVRPTAVILSFDIEAEENLRMMIKRSLGVDLW